MMIVNTLLPTFTATVSGLAPSDTPLGFSGVVINGNAVPSLTGPLSLSSPGTSQSAIGNYSITPSGVSSSNYSISFMPGTLSILLRTAADPLQSMQNGAIASTVQSMGDLTLDAGSSALPSPGRRIFASGEGEEGARSDEFHYSKVVSLAIRDSGLRIPAKPLETLGPSNRR
jgi:hypothetical protein